MQVVEKVVGQLVLRGSDNDALEVLGLDESIAILIEEMERLTDTLALQSAEHLRELIIRQLMPILLPPRV